MIFVLKKASKFHRTSLTGWIYNTKDDFKNANVVYMEMTGDHGKIKNTLSDRVYYIISGKGEFVINQEITQVTTGDVVIVPKDIAYDFKAVSGKMKILLVSTPAFDEKFEFKM
jgi:mannose-6-phosphate isomerase-like protein (cupin superfamily)